MTIFRNVFQRHLEGHDAEYTDGNAPIGQGPIDMHEDPDDHADFFAPDLPAARTQPPMPQAEDLPAFSSTREPAGVETDDMALAGVPSALDAELAARAAEAHRLIEETQAIRHGAPEARDDELDGAPPQDSPPNRARTRLLGFGNTDAGCADPLSALTESSAQAQFPCGWLVIVGGPGRGASFALHPGMSQIGRSADQTIALDFGDRAVSRERHAVVAYDPELGKFFVGHGGKSNIIRLNDRPVLSTEEMNHGDTLSIGETKLRFAAFCDQSFSWSEGDS